MHKIFIDGAAGTTAIQIRYLLKEWENAGDIALLSIKNPRNKAQRKSAFSQADLSILCLPDDAAKEAIKLSRSTKTRIIDASSAHRVNSQWVYGFPELGTQQINAIKKARLVTNPGCFATGAVAILRPLIEADIINKNDTHTIWGVSGYSGGGKKLIEKHETMGDKFSMDNVFGAYSLNGQHKHIPEIKKHAGLTAIPIFIPHVINVPRGMMISITFNKAALNNSSNKKTIHKVLQDFYDQADSKVNVMPLQEQQRLNFEEFSALQTEAVAPLDTLNLYVSGWEDSNDTQVTIHALLDNLGKGAATQAVQNMKLMLGI